MGIGLLAGASRHIGRCDVTSSDPTPPVDGMGESRWSPWQWSDADKCLFVSGIVIPLTALHVVVEGLFLARPEPVPYFDTASLRWLAILQGTTLVGWIAIAVAALVFRRRQASNHGLVHLAVQLYAISFTLTSYWVGHFTSSYLGVVLIGGAAVGFLLFDKTPALLAVGTGVLLLVLTTALERASILRYGPLLSSAPFRDGRLSEAWFAYTSPTVAVAFVVIVLIYHVCYRLRANEKELGRTAAELVRANDTISRYVASQLARYVRAGKSAALEKQERRTLTLFFSDIRDFAATADHVDLENLSEVLNDYLSEMVTIGERYDGTIDKFVGDAIMMFFGAPISTNDRDHALRAVHMAIEMQERMVTLRQKWLRQGFDRPFEIRIGINTGQASVGNFGSKGRMDYTAVGRHVNLAARLQAACLPGKILISHTTWLLVQDEIVCMPRGEIQVKGFKDAVSVYEVAGVLRHSTGTGDVLRAS
jgi:class 3 adenylate cyclase